MTTSLGKRSSVNGISDIAYTIQKAPVQTSGDQFVQGVKSFSGPIKALNDVYCSGKYYGDGSKLTNVTALDNTKLPLAGGTVTGDVHFTRPASVFTSLVRNDQISCQVEGSDNINLMNNSYNTIENSLKSAVMSVNGYSAYTVLGEELSISSHEVSYTPVGGIQVIKSWADILAGLDPTKLPLTGGVLSGPVRVGVVVAESIEISEIGIRARGVNGETRITPDVINVHEGATVRNQLSAPSLNFNDDIADKYVGMGTSTITGNVCGFLTVDGATANNVALGLTPAPTLRLENTAASIATLTPDSLFLNDSSSTTSALLTQNQLTMDNGVGVSCGLAYNQLGFDDTTSGAGAFLSANSLSLSGNGSSNSLSADVGLRWDPNIWGGATTFGNNGVVISGSDYNTNHTISGISIERPSTTQMTYYTEGVLNIANSQIKYMFQNDGQFMKWNCGTSFRYDTGDHHVRKDQSFKVSEGGMSFDFEAYTEYLDDQGDVGWSVLLSNQEGGDVAVNSPDCQFYSHTTGWTGTTISLKKYATARFTLVTTTLYSPGYAWAVSMY